MADSFRGSIARHFAGIINAARLTLHQEHRHVWIRAARGVRRKCQVAISTKDYNCLCPLYIQEHIAQTYQRYIKKLSFLPFPRMRPQPTNIASKQGVMMERRDDCGWFYWRDKQLAKLYLINFCLLFPELLLKSECHEVARQ